MIERFSKNDFDQIFQIMEDSFPLNERRPYSEQKALWDTEFYRAIGVRRDGRIIAFLAFWEFEDFTYLEHLATTPECRNSGIGKEIIRYALENADKPVCLEVEPPEDELTRRRIAFYERNGMFLNLYPYIQPAISKGREPIPLLIMTSGAKISEDEYIKMRDVIYKNVYHV